MIYNSRSSWVTRVMKEVHADSGVLFIVNSARSASVIQSDNWANYSLKILRPKYPHMKLIILTSSIFSRSVLS